VDNHAIAAVVVLYYPNSSVLNNIKSYADKVSKLYIVDNTDNEVSHKQILDTFLNAEVLHKGENIGIAKALNIALECARSDGYAWLLTMDQDTSFPNNGFIQFFQHFKVLIKEKDSVAIYTPLHNKKFLQNNLYLPYKQVKYVMSSANIVNIAKALSVGGYEERFFIDEVDHEFCFRIRSSGYTIWEDNTIAVSHQLGEKYNNRTLYNAVRLYYMTRNYLYLKRDYYDDDPDFFQNRDRYLRKFFLQQILYGKKRIYNFYMISIGVLDFILNHVGKKR